MDGVELRLALEQECVPTGHKATGQLVVRAAGATPVDLETGDPMVGMVLDDEGQVVGIYTGNNLRGRDAPSAGPW